MKPNFLHDHCDFSASTVTVDSCHPPCPLPLLIRAQGSGRGDLSGTILKVKLIVLILLTSIDLDSRGSPERLIRS